jgi:hypothetical protein
MWKRWSLAMARSAAVKVFALTAVRIRCCRAPLVPARTNEMKSSDASDADAEKYVWH